MSAHQWFTEYLSLSGARNTGRRWQCPAHVDGVPSLSVSPGDEGRVLIHCFGGCPSHEVIAALGLGMNALFEASPYPPEHYLRLVRQKPTYAEFQGGGGGSSSRALGANISVDHHIYIQDSVRLERRRYSGGRKTCCWEVKRGTDWHYAKDLHLGDLPLYEEQQVMMGIAADEPIVVCESESSVDALYRAGIYATTWAGGASNPQVRTLRRVLAGGRVVIIPDNDRAGIACGDRIAEALEGVAGVYTMLPPPNNDARDLLQEIGGDALLCALTNMTQMTQMTQI